MFSPRILLSTLFACIPVLLTGCSAPDSEATSTTVIGNPITGEGLPNPAPIVTTNWGELPAGREWGSTAGIDIDPTDGHIWAYERCGASSFGGGVPVNCENNPVDPIFKFDRNTGEMLALPAGCPSDRRCCGPSARQAGTTLFRRARTPSA